jgi:hypothetical protein
LRGKLNAAGTSGSVIARARLFVPVGIPCQERGGETTFFSVYFSGMRPLFSKAGERKTNMVPPLRDAGGGDERGTPPV